MHAMHNNETIIMLCIGSFYSFQMEPITGLFEGTGGDDPSLTTKQRDGLKKFQKCDFGWFDRLVGNPVLFRQPSGRSEKINGSILSLVYLRIVAGSLNVVANEGPYFRDAQSSSSRTYCLSI
jgi:hypothetical protein